MAKSPVDLETCMIPRPKHARTSMWNQHLPVQLHGNLIQLGISATLFAASIGQEIVNDMACQVTNAAWECMRHNCQSSIMDGGLHLRLLRLQLRDQTRPLRPLCGILCHGPWMSMACSAVQTYAQHLLHLLCVMVYHVFQIVSVPRIDPPDHPLFISDGSCCVSTGFNFLRLLSFWSCGSSYMFVR